MFNVCIVEGAKGVSAFEIIPNFKLNVLERLK